MILAKFAEAISNKDMGLLESLLHDEFLFVEETTLETKEEWLKEMKRSPLASKRGKLRGPKCS